MDSEESKRIALKPMFNLDLQYNDTAKKDSEDCPQELAMLQPYSSMLETSLENS